MRIGLRLGLLFITYTPPVNATVNMLETRYSKVVIMGHTNIQTHFLPITSFASWFFLSDRNRDRQTTNDTIPTGLIIQPKIKMFPMLKNKLESQYRVIAKQTVDATQKKQKIPFKIDVIFKAFNVFILSPLYFIIQHRRLGVNSYYLSNIERI